jgi:hypothetical protein
VIPVSRAKKSAPRGKKPRQPTKSKLKSAPLAASEGFNFTSSPVVTTSFNSSCDLSPVAVLPETDSPRTLNLSLVETSMGADLVSPRLPDSVNHSDVERTILNLHNKLDQVNTSLAIDKLERELDFGELNRRVEVLSNKTQTICPELAAAASREQNPEPPSAPSFEAMVQHEELLNSLNRLSTRVDVLTESLLQIVDSQSQLLKQNLSILEFKLENITLQQTSQIAEVVGKLTAQVHSGVQSLNDKLEDLKSPEAEVPVGDLFSINTIISSKSGKIQIRSAHVDPVPQRIDPGLAPDLPITLDNCGFVSVPQISGNVPPGITLRRPNGRRKNNRRVTPTGNLRKSASLDSMPLQASSDNVTMSPVDDLDAKPVSQTDPIHKVSQPVQWPNLYEAINYKNQQHVLQTRPRKTPIVLLGDSHVRAIRIAGRGCDSKTWTWPGLRAEQLEYRLSDIAPTLGNAEKIVICVGSNNVMLDTAESIIDSLTRAVRHLKRLCPMAHIVCVGILPQVVRGVIDPNGRIARLNSEVFKMCKSLNIQFLLIWNQVLCHYNAISKDGIHLTGMGKSIFSQEIFKAIEDNQYLGNWGI